jgi:iron complex transport system permease protein
MQISVVNVYAILTKNIPILNSLVKGNPTVTETSVVMQVRLPRVIGAAIVGIALTSTGVVLQGLFRNPMADPYVLGISSGASLGASLPLAFGLGTSTLGYLYAMPLMAFIGAVSTIFIVYGIAKRFTNTSMLSLLLIGIAANSFLSAIVSLIKLLSTEAVHGIMFWILGSFQPVGWNYVTIASPIILAGTIAIYYYARDLNMISLGETQAQHLGVDAEKLKTRLLILASLVTAAAVSISGIIGFVGLIIPHTTRLLIGPDHRILIPASSILGAIVLILCDTLSRTLMSPAEIPVGIITALLGSPFFVYLLTKRKSNFGP